MTRWAKTWGGSFICLLSSRARVLSLLQTGVLRLDLTSLPRFSIPCRIARVVGEGDCGGSMLRPSASPASYLCGLGFFGVGMNGVPFSGPGTRRGHDSWRLR